MARIRDIRLIPLAYRMPDMQAYGMARGLTAERGCALLEVETEDGVVGIGEAWGPARATAGYLEVIKAAYVGRELYERELIWSDIICRRYHLGLQSQLTACVSGINIAIYDAMGKTLGLPVCKLLGGHGARPHPGLRLRRLSHRRSREPAASAARADRRQGLRCHQVQDRPQSEVGRGAGAARPADPR